MGKDAFVKGDRKRAHVPFFVYIIAMSVFPLQIHAAPALDSAFELRQPSGVSFEARQYGDEWHNWVETKDGYGIYQNKATSNWEYYLPSADTGLAEGVNGRLPLQGISNVIVGEADPSSLGIPKGLRPLKTSARNPKMPDTEADTTPHDTPHPNPLPQGERELSFPQGTRENGCSPLPSENGFSAGLEPKLKSMSVSGTIPLLVIGVDYATTIATYTPEQVQTVIFGNSSSVKDYFSNTSYSSVSITPATESHGTSNDGFIGWLRLSGSHPNTGSSTNIQNQWIAKNAILAADPYIDYASYDTNGNGIVEPTELSIIIMVAGYEAAFRINTPSVWAHRWDMGSVGYPSVDGKIVQQYAQFGERHYGLVGSVLYNHLATCGIIAHELGHLMFSLPDLYDTYTGNGDSEGVGYFDLMGSGCWGAALEAYPGSSPTHLSAWSKEYLSWGSINTISSNQPVSFPKVDGNSSSIFRINTQNSNQYFLLENRQFTGYDTGFRWKTDTGTTTGHGGLVIYHIDRLKTNNADENDKMVDVEEANEGSLGFSMLDTNATRAHTDMFYFLGNNTSFTDATTPNSRLKNGNSTNISVTDISAYGDTMTANITLTVETTTTTTTSTTTTSSTTTTTTTSTTTTTLRPTVVTMLSFMAEANDDGSVTLSWETATEVNNAGFNIYRSRRKDGAYKKINGELIDPKGDEVTGASYSFVDTPPSHGTYYYKLEDVEYGGKTTMHGPVKVRVKAGESEARRRK